jgi:multiple sugar transport system substrate-binding protein
LQLAGFYEDAVKTLAAEFERQTGIRVNVKGAMLINLREKELTDLITHGGNYDIVQVPHQWEGEILPRLQPLDGALNQIVPDFEDVIPNLRTNCGWWNGRIYGLPMACDVITILYRKDIFAAHAGEFKKLTGRALEPPRTWPEYLEIASFLNSESTYGNILMGGDQLYTVWSGILYGMGGRPVDEQWRPLLDSEEGVRSLTLFAEMFKYAPSRSETRGIPEANNLFLQGHGAMYICWPSLVWARMNDTNACKVAGLLGAAVIPGARPQLSSWCLGVNPLCRDKDAAYKWLSFFVNRTNANRLLLEKGIGSPRLSTYSNPACRQRIFYLGEMFQGLAGAEPRFRIAPSQELTDYLDAELLRTIRGTSTPQKALNRTASRWWRILSETGYLKDPNPAPGNARPTPGGKGT